MVKKVRLSKEHVFQKEDDKNCGPCCLSMVYRIKGKKFSVEQILKDLNLEEKGEATYPPELARHLNVNGLKTNLYISNPQVISPAWNKLSKVEVIDLLKMWLVRQPKHDWHKYGLHTLFYLQEGGNVELKSYSVEDFKTILDSGSLMILCVDEVWIWGHRFKTHKARINEITGKTHGHFVVVTGYRGSDFDVLDPYPTKLKKRCGKYTVHGAQLLNSSLIWGSTILEIKK